MHHNSLYYLDYHRNTSREKWLIKIWSEAKMQELSFEKNILQNSTLLFDSPNLGDNQKKTFTNNERKKLYYKTAAGLLLP